MRSLLVDRKLFASDPLRFEETVASTREHLNHLSAYYPAFAYWYDEKVAPGLVQGTRSLLLRDVGGRLGAVAIVKDDGLEKKLCCLRVLPHLAGSGLGLRMFDDVFETLGTDRPLLSVAGEQLPKFSRIFDHFGFQMGHRYHDLYRVGSHENSFNGTLTPQWNTKMVRESSDELSVLWDSR